MTRFAAIAFFATALLAATAFAEDTDKNGFYAGVVLGYSHNDLDLNTGATTDNTSLHAGEFGVVGGYQLELPSNFFVAAEAEALVSFGKENGLLGSSVDVDKQNTFGLYAKPGYHLNDQWSAFVTLGVQWANYQLRNVASGYETDNDSAGFLYGVGADYQLDRDVSLTLEYNRVEQSDIDYSLSAGTTTTVDPTSDIVKLALKYHF